MSLGVLAPAHPAGLPFWGLANVHKHWLPQSDRLPSICTSAGGLGSVPSDPHLPGMAGGEDGGSAPSCPVQVAGEGSWRVVP
jgi:hypothetical protein